MIVLPSSFFPLKQKKLETSNLVKLFFSQLPQENGGKGAGEVKPEREKVNMMNGKSSEWTGSESGGMRTALSDCIIGAWTLFPTALHRLLH